MQGGESAFEMGAMHDGPIQVEVRGRVDMVVVIGMNLGRGIIRG